MPPLIIAVAIVALAVLAIVLLAALAEHYYVQLETSVGDIGTSLSLEPM